MAKLIDLTTLAKTSVASTDYLLVTNDNSRQSKRLAVETLFPSFSTLGSSSESLFVSVTNKNQLNFKGIKSGDTGLLTVTTSSNNIVLTALEAGIDLSLCNNTTSGFITGIDFTSTITGECPVSNGGTGLSTIAKGALLYANETDQIAATAAMSTNGHLLIGNATNGYPSVATLTAGTNMTVTNGAGSITLAANLSTLTADLDAAGYDIDLHTGWLSGDGTHEGINIDSTGKVFMGQSTPTAFFEDSLNIIGGIRFANTSAPTIKPNDSGDGVVGANVTIQAGASSNSASGHLNLNAGSASSSGTAGSVILTSGQSASGTDGDIQLKTYSGSSPTAGLTVAAEGQNVTVNTGNLVITDAAKGIVHTGSGTGTQSAGALTNGVTINATSGIITLSATGLAAATNAEFTFTNSTIQADSVILLTMQDANTTNNAQLTCALVSINGSGGDCVISVHNPAATGTTSATASKIHFLVINNS